MNDNVTPFPKAVASAPPGEPDPKIIKLLELALEAARLGKINFVATVAMPSDGGKPIIAAAGKADPHRVIGAMLQGAVTNLGA